LSWVWALSPHPTQQFLKSAHERAVMSQTTF